MSLIFSHASERDRPVNLQRITLNRVRVREFMQKLEAHDSLSDRQDDICRPANGVDPVVAGMLGIYTGAAVVAGLPLPVANHAHLQKGVHVFLQRKNLRQGVVQVEGLAGMNIGPIPAWYGIRTSRYAENAVPLFFVK